MVRGDLRACRNEFGRSDRHLFEINRNARLAMVAAPMPMPVSENLESLDADDGHLSLAIMSSVSLE